MPEVLRRSRLSNGETEKKIVDNYLIKNIYYRDNLSNRCSLNDPSTSFLGVM